MAKKKAKKSEFDYPATFDRLMSEHFGETFRTEWNLFAGSWGGYVTVRAGGKPLTKTQIKVGKTISNAIAAGQGADNGPA
jgi:hypothetical protein